MNRYLILGSALATLALSMSAQAGHVDFFTDPPAGQSVVDDASGLDFNEAGNFPNTILGGFRDLAVVAASGAVGNGDNVCGPLELCSTLAVTGGILNFSNDTGNPAVDGRGTVQWDGNDNSPNLNLNPATNLFSTNDDDLVFQTNCPATGCTQFELEIFFADIGFVFTIGLYTDANTYTEIDFLSAGVAAPETRIFPFDIFTFAGNCNLGAIPEGAQVPGTAIDKRCGANPVDMQNVGAMFVVLNPVNIGAPNPANEPGTLAVDLSVGAFTKGVPEPTTLALMGAGLFGIGVARLRRRRSVKA